MAVSAAQLQHAGVTNSAKLEGRPGSSTRRRWRAHRGFCLAAGLILIGWLLRDRQWLSAEHGVGYLLGYVALACMLLLLLFPLRKRWRALRFLGSTPKWFRNHMFLGVCGPIAALYHCNFQLGSLNSRIALFSALIVATSGLIGRFIYTKIHHGLYGRKANLKELLAQVRLTAPAGVRVGSFVPELMKRMAEFDRAVLVPPTGVADSMILPFALALKTRLHYFHLMRFVRRRLIAESVHAQLTRAHRDRLERATRDHIRRHLRHIRRVAEFVAYERLFALWHKVHVPFFFMLVISTFVHVLAVYLY